jgi:hypothetical protein
MKDFLPNFTFGFLMAQLFPGAVTVLCLTCPYVAWTSNAWDALGSAKVLLVVFHPSLALIAAQAPAAGMFPRLIDLFSKVGDTWFGTTRNSVVFLFFAAATGMFLHGLDWLVLGWETTKCDDNGKPIEGYVSIREMPFHSQPVWKQLMFAPFHMLKETIRLISVPQIKWMTMDENLPQIAPSSLPLFTWLQDFYLYFGQFYIHMSYSLLIGFLSILGAYSIIGLTSIRLLFLVFLYSLTGVFFLMGRTQLASLFKNEDALINASHAGTDKPYHVVISRKP